MRIRYLTVALCLLLFGCVYRYPINPSVPPEKPASTALSFEGIRMRSSLEEIQKTQSGFELAQKSKDGHVQMLFGKSLRPLGVDATQLSAALYDGKLAEVIVKFAPSDAAKAYQALVTNFGQPSVEITPGQCADDYNGCAATWYYGQDAITFNGPAGRWALVDTKVIDRVVSSMAQ
jgi:hypothetical protein